MSSFGVGRLQRVALREVWKHEAQDFTQWLQNNIEVLNESLDLNLLGANREKSAGDFRVDLVAEDEDGGTVIIDNRAVLYTQAMVGKH
jgi:RecB family endonuclease NucS